MDIMLLVYFGLITIRKYVFLLMSHDKSKYFVPDKYIIITGRVFMTFTDITSNTKI
jgi:hypothetical protein